MSDESKRGEPGRGEPRKDGSERLEHWVDDRPFDPDETTAMSPEQERYYLAGQWTIQGVLIPLS